MNLGLVFPQTEFGNDPLAIRDYAQTAEGLGFTHIVAYDHALGANPNRPGGWRGRVAIMLVSKFTIDEVTHRSYNLIPEI
jgi:hypothetical protein